MHNLNDRYHALFCTNRSKDLPYLAVAIRSLVEHFGEPERLVVHVLRTHLNLSHLKPLEESLTDLPCELRHHCLHERLAPYLEMKDFGYWPFLWFDERLPNGLKRLVYLDCDMVVCDDLTPLWHLELGECVVGAVPDPGSRVHRCSQTLAAEAPKLGFTYRPDDPYFNSGLLVIDLEKWRAEAIPEQVEKLFAHDFAQLRFHDQDALNLLLQGRVRPLSPRWNLIESLFLYQDWDFDLYRAFGPPQDYFVPAVRHFSGSQKPDTPLIRRSEAELYFQYLGPTEWGIPERSIREAFKRRLLGDLLELHYIVVRGLRQKALHTPYKRLAEHILRAPYSLLLYPLIYIRRLFLGGPVADELSTREEPEW